MSIVTDGLLSYWKFQDNANASLGTAQINGTVTGTSIYSCGPKNVGKCFDFNGATRINVNGSGIQPIIGVDGATGLSFDFWMKIPTLGTMFIVNLGSGTPSHNIQIDTTNIYLQIAGSGATFGFSAANVNPTIWNHWSILYDGANIYVFVNKVLKLKSAHSTALSYINTTNTIGSRGDGVSPLTGVLDEFKIYKTALSHGTAETVGDVATGEVAQNFDDIAFPAEKKMKILSQGFSNSLVELKARGSSIVPVEKKTALPRYVTRGLVSYWPLTENGAYTGDYHDLAYLLTGSATINNGTRIGTGLPTDGPRTLGMDCTTDDSVNIPSHSSLVPSTKYSYAIWARKITGGSYLLHLGVAGGTDQSFLVYESSNIIWKHNGGGSGFYLTIPNGTWDNNEWTQIVIVWDSTQAFGSRLCAYINGKFLKYADQDTGTSQLQTSGKVTIGDYDIHGGNLTGHLAEVLAYPTVALTAEEVKQNFDAVIKDMPISNGLVSYWKLDEDSATGVPVKDSAMKEFDSGSGNDGTRTGTSPQVAKGINGEVVQSFNGDDSIEVPANGAWETVNYTMMGWIQINDNTTTMHPLFSKNGGDFELAVSWNSSTAGNLWASMNGLSGLLSSPTNSIGLTQWVHCAYTQSSTTAKLFINGIQVAYSASGSRSQFSGGSLWIGKRPSSWNFNGNFSKYKFYNHPLSSWEIRKAYEFDLGTPNIVTRGLVSWWRLQDNGNATGNMRDSAYRTFGVGASTPNDGTKTGTCNSIAGVWGQALDFGGDDYINLSNIVGTGAITEESFEIWIKDFGTGNYYLAQLGTWGAETYMELNASNLIVTGNGAGNGVCSFARSSIAPNRWNQFVWTYKGANPSGSRGHLYVNGVQVAADNVTPFGTTLTQRNAGQLFATVNVNPLNGKGGDVKYYSVELTATEVLQNYNAYRRGI